MALTTVPRKVIYNGNGGPFAYAIPFKFFRDEHVKVVLKAPSGEEFEQTLGADYVVSGRGKPTGGEFRMFQDVPEDWQICAFRSVAPYLQNVLFPEHGEFPALTYSDTLDIVHMALQELADDRNHTFSVSLFTEITNTQDLSLLTLEPASVLTTDTSKNLRWVPITEFMGGGTNEAWHWKCRLGDKNFDETHAHNQLVNYGPFKKGDVLIVDAHTNEIVKLRDMAGKIIEAPGRLALVCYSTMGGSFWENFFPIIGWPDNRGYPQADFVPPDWWGWTTQPDVPPDPDPIDIVILPDSNSIPPPM